MLSVNYDVIDKLSINYKEKEIEQLVKVGIHHYFVDPIKARLRRIEGRDAIRARRKIEGRDAIRARRYIEGRDAIQARRNT